jgi:hypothetical protein
MNQNEKVAWLLPLLLRPRVCVIDAAKAKAFGEILRNLSGGFAARAQMRGDDEAWFSSYRYPCDFDF